MTRKSPRLSPQQRNRKRRKKRRTQKKSLNAHLSEVSRREWEKQFGPPERELSLRDASCPPPVPKTVEQRSADTRVRIRAEAEREALLKKTWCPKTLESRGYLGAS